MRKHSTILSEVFSCFCCYCFYTSLLLKNATLMLLIKLLLLLLLLLFVFFFCRSIFIFLLINEICKNRSVSLVRQNVAISSNRATLKCASYALYIMLLKLCILVRVNETIPEDVVHVQMKWFFIGS